MLCTTCNWHPHDLSVHGKLCINGHPVAIVGRYGNGVCRVCQRAMSKRYDTANRERKRTHASPEVTPRDNGDDTGERSVAGPGAAAVTVAPTTLPGGWDDPHRLCGDVCIADRLVVGRVPPFEDAT
jgi:hypothetical protein